MSYYFACRLWARPRTMANHTHTQSEGPNAGLELRLRLRLRVVVLAMHQSRNLNACCSVLTILAHPFRAFNVFMLAWPTKSLHCEFCISDTL